MLERFSEYFYDPMVFWAAPLILVVLAAGWRKVRARSVRGPTGKPPGKDSGNLT